MSSQQIMSSAEPSVCIPRVFMNIKKERILTVFTELFGDERAIDHIDMVEKASPNGDKYQRVFVHFRQWPTTRDAQEMRRQLLDNKDVKIVYDDPWFWKCSASHAKRPDARETKPRGPYIMMNNDDSRREQSQPRQQYDERPRDYQSRSQQERQRDYPSQSRQHYDERPREYQSRPRYQPEDRRQQQERQREYQPRQQQDDNHSIARTHHKPTYQPSSSSRPVVTRRPKLKIDVSCTDAEASQTLESVTTTNATSTSADVTGSSPPYNPTTPPTTPTKLQTEAEAPGAPKKTRSTRTKFIVTTSSDDE
jgi:hypothetical protein